MQYAVVNIVGCIQLIYIDCDVLSGIGKHANKAYRHPATHPIKMGTIYGLLKLCTHTYTTWLAVPSRTCPGRNLKGRIGIQYEQCMMKLTNQVLLKSSSFLMSSSFFEDRFSSQTGKRS